MRLFRPAEFTLALLAITPILAQTMRENIDNACIQVLGKPCYPAPLSSTYDTINIMINKGQLTNSVGSIMNNYLIPMLRSNQGMQANVVDWAWPSAGCQGSPDEATWMRAFATGSLSTYQQLVNQLHKIPGCAPPPPPPPPPPQYVPIPQMTVAYQQIWGPLAWNATPPMTNCPVAVGAVSCARSALMAYAKTNPGILSSVVQGTFRPAIGFAPDPYQLAGIDKSYLFFWTGADDLTGYLNNTRAAWGTPPATMNLKMDTNGNLLDGNNRLIPNTAHSYFLSVVNGNIIAQGGGNYTAQAGPGGPMVLVKPGPPSGVLVDAQSQPYSIVAAGAGNFQLRNSAGIVAQGGLNIILNGGGNIVSQGAGNIVAQGGLNLQSYARQQALMRTIAGVVSNDGGTLISQDGAGINLAKLGAYFSRAGR